MLDYIIAHPLYIPFIILNIYIIYKVIKMVVGKDQGRDDDDQDGGISNNDNPVLDLPPGVGLPTKESILNVSTNID
ncbi:hypothetical protein [Belliella aquatica]|uniref:Uncharacterized protein n=1 Tax=Belliella aquatica TaxID=1323734 RepID=A0ABQ1LRG8_9BACT|nr:hypothetical protein [Belliella aquatica]MCH7404305.1 hypothetical protein [Belliella aquatica]GGC26955.1 hypothetical protein GCM10010993_02530 [Belliella aquatica]